MPVEEGQLLLYSNKCAQDFEYLTALLFKKAKKSIYILSYGFQSQNLLNLLEHKANNGIEVDLHLDHSYYRPKNSNLNITSKAISGLMHKKCIIIDRKLVLLGSTNLTRTSLKLHNNLFIAIYNENLVKSILENTNYYSKAMSLEHTENNSQQILNKILSHINSAKKSIHIAMFTFTHKEILSSLIKAHKRGVQLSIYLDKMQSQGCGKNIVDTLKKHDIKVKHNKARPLLHHKLCLIDNKILLTGSLNWTQAGFKKNKELFLTINNINETQKKTLHEILNLLDK